MNHTLKNTTKPSSGQDIFERLKALGGKNNRPPATVAAAPSPLAGTLGFRRIAVSDAERALVYRNRRFERVAGPGVLRFFDPFRHVEVRLLDLHEPEYPGADAEALIERLGDRLTETFVLADIGVSEVGLLLRNGRLEALLAPGSRSLFAKGPSVIAVEKLALPEDREVPPAVARRLRQTGMLERYAVAVNVPAQSRGLVFIDGKLARELEPGAYAFFNFERNVHAQVIELRVQTAEVSGQELLTRDRVSLRVNLSASYRIADPITARSRLADYDNYLYRELQFGLRKSVSGKTLDELLGDKASLDADIFAYVRGRVTEYGIEILGVGVKDVILPGEMKDILNGVVAAAKQAEANVIRRREEANATRSALNTAKLLEESPLLLRLKELETLEKVSERVGKLTVFGGLDGVLGELVKLRRPG